MEREALIRVVDNEISAGGTPADLVPAVPQDFLFHWAPVSNCKGIQEKGLLRKSRPHFYDYFQAACLTSAPREWESDAFRDHALWLVDVREATLFFDPEMMAYRRDYLSLESIPAESVMLYEKWKLLYD